VTRALVSVLWWRDVPVETAPPPKLTELDSFMVLATERLGAVDLALFQDITGLPEVVFHGLSRRLHSLGQLDLTDWVLRPRPGPAAGFPEPTVTRRTIPTTTDFLYLPDTDDLVAVPAGLDSWERAVPRNPRTGRILPASMRRMTVRSLIADRIERGLVAGLPAHIVGLGDGRDEPLTAMVRAMPQPDVPVCPVVTCSASVVLAEDRPRVTLTVPPRSDTRAVDVDLSGATGLVGRWSRLAGRLGEPAVARQAAATLGLPETAAPPLRPEHPGSWWMPVTGEQAGILARKGPLTAPFGLAVRDDRDEVLVMMQAEGSDEAAKTLIDRDMLVQNLLSRHGGDGPLLRPDERAVRGAGGLFAIRSRAWELGYYGLVHALREKEDFAYV
jgi:hypothetical protein